MLAAGGIAPPAVCIFGAKSGYFSRNQMITGVIYHRL
jgi:hypothetical protein